MLVLDPGFTLHMEPVDHVVTPFKTVVYFVFCIAFFKLGESAEFK